jgi:iron complex transport system substrate-binding protein
MLLLAATTAHAGPSVVDDSGTRVALAQPAGRIVSLAPHATELLFAVGAGERIVATVSYSDHPEAAKSLPRVGSYDNVNVEAVLAHDPDLVVAWKSGNPADQIERLQALDLPVYVNEPRSLEGIAASLRRLAVLAGVPDQGRAAAEDFRARLANLRAAHAGAEPVRVFYQVWNDPLMTVNGDHVITDVIRGCGGRNVFAGLGPIAPRVGVESVLERQPTAIVASGMDASRPEWLDMWREWPELRAVARDWLFHVPPDLIQRHTPRILDGMERLCEQLDRVRRERGLSGE